MPRSFGNKTFIVPPTRVIAEGDAADLADLQEATKHMTIMNRYTSGLDQAVRRVVLSSGAVATVRRAFGHESITIDRRGVGGRRPPCEPYMESGRQWWGKEDTTYTGYIDISSDITGANGFPFPAQPIAAGISAALKCSNPNDISACGLEKFRKKDARISFPESGFTGKLHKLVQCVWGSKRTDILGSSLAGVELSNTLSRSSILYTDATNNYWMIQISGITSATMQAWSPLCSSDGDASPEGREAYHLFSLVPRTDEVSISCAGGVELQSGEEPIAYGWHATQRGNEGHICILSSDSEQGGLYKYELTDSGAARQPGQSVDEYIAARFSITFSNVISEAFGMATYGFDRIIRPTVDGLKRMPSWPQTSYPDGGFHQPLCPVYCRYRLDDTLDVIYYSADVVDYQEDVIGDGIDPCAYDGCKKDIVYTGWHEATCGFTVGSVEPKHYPGYEIRSSRQVHREISGGGQWLDIPPGGCTPCQSYIDEWNLWTNVYFCGFIDVQSYWESVETTVIENSLTRLQTGGQALVIPNGVCESFCIFDLDLDSSGFSSVHREYVESAGHVSAWTMDCENCSEPTPVRHAEGECDSLIPGYHNSGTMEYGERTVDEANADWHIDYKMKGMYYPRTGEPQEIIDFDESYGTMLLKEDVSCGEEASGDSVDGWFGYFAGGLNIPYCPDETSPLCTENPFYNMYFWHHPLEQPSYQIPNATVRESYQFGHINGWFDEDKEYVIHHGYDDFKEECAFTGKS